MVKMMDRNTVTSGLVRPTWRESPSSIPHLINLVHAFRKESEHDHSTENYANGPVD